MFEIHDVYKPSISIGKMDGPLRVLDTVGFDRVIVIALDTSHPRMPFSISYNEWVGYLNSSRLTKIQDPFDHLTSIPSNLPKGAANRLKQVIDITDALSINPNILYKRKSLSGEITKIAKSLSLSDRTVKRWVCEWLQAGRNPVAVVKTFVHGKDRKAPKTQTSGAKRGVQKTILKSCSDAPAHEVEPKIKLAYDSYIVRRKMIWRDAYHEMLISLFGVPISVLSDDDRGLFLDPDLVQKYRVPTWMQFRYRCRQLKKALLLFENELPLGKRGRAKDGIPGPGFYEIDATHFQIQLVSRLTKNELVGRPTVYLIVDVYDGIIAGYAVTLENPSWATAALALYNCFSDKASVFERLGLPYKSADWPCHHLPNLLRADRAELVSNMGQRFPASGIRVEITPSMTPIAKGSVEGKNAEIKKPQNGRFDLPGRFSKMRGRRQPDGKKTAALDIFAFEQILVEIIIDLNGSPVNPRQIPPDALHLGAEVASRTGFHRWALINRAGFTRNMGRNFIYEHLLTKARATVTPYGLRVQGEIFNCDRLRELGLLNSSLENEVKITASYNPHLATEIFLFDPEAKAWIPAYNTDPEIYQLKASFAEAKEYRARQQLLIDQADLNNYGRRRKRVVAIRKVIKKSLQEKKEEGGLVLGSKKNIRENRAQERAGERSSGLNGSLPAEDYSTQANNDNRNTGHEARNQSNPEINQERKSLWSEVHAVNKI
jgi:hypothetical protein